MFKISTDVYGSIQISNSSRNQEGSVTEFIFRLTIYIYVCVSEGESVFKCESEGKAELPFCSTCVQIFFLRKTADIIL